MNPGQVSVRGSLRRGRSRAGCRRPRRFVSPPAPACGRRSERGPPGLREVRAFPEPSASSQPGLGRCEVWEASGRGSEAGALTTRSGSGSCRGKGPRKQRNSALFTRFVASPVPFCVCSSPPGCTKEQAAGLGSSCGAQEGLMSNSVRGGGLLRARVGADRGRASLRSIFRR